MANLTDMLSKFVTANTASTSGSGTLPGNTITNPKEDLKGITTRSGVTIQGPKAVNHDTEVTKDTMPPANNGSTEDVQPPVVQIQTSVNKSRAHVALVVELPGWASKVLIKRGKLNEAPKEPLPITFMDQNARRKNYAGNQSTLFLDGSRTMLRARQFQRCMMAIFHDMIEKTMEVFMDDFSVFGDSFSTCLTHLEKMLKRCEDTNLSLNWEKSHFMVKEGIVLGHKISKSGLEVDRAKVEVIAKLPHPTSVKGVRSFLGHAGFYRRFIQDFSKIARPMTHLLEKETPFVFSEECIDSFNTLKRKLTEAPILIAPDWDLPFELMCDASDFAIGAVLGQRKNKHFQPIHYASKTMNEAQTHYTTTEKELQCLLENPRTNKSEQTEINEAFPLETLGSIALKDDRNSRIVKTLILAVFHKEFHILSFSLGIQERGLVQISFFKIKLQGPDKIVALRTDNQEKDEKQSQNDKTGLGMEKTVKDKAKSKPENQSSQSQHKSTPGPKSKKYKFRG
ncbi:reverse transcriptase domain-containing protein [Tanacetum coccineum]